MFKYFTCSSCNFDNYFKLMLPIVCLYHVLVIVLIFVVVMVS